MPFIIHLPSLNPFPILVLTVISPAIPTLERIEDKGWKFALTILQVLTYLSTVNSVMTYYLVKFHNFKVNKLATKRLLG